MISGSSDAGLAAARAISATAVKYPKPPGEEQDQRSDTIDSGVRVGIIARETSEEAWRVALERFPEDRKGQITHKLAMKVSDSSWHKQLSTLGEKPVSEENPYWLGPFENYKTFCPYLVGSYDRVADEVGALHRRWASARSSSTFRRRRRSSTTRQSSSVRPSADRRFDVAASRPRLADNRNGSQTPLRSSWVKSD